jgi:hypothetical protein
LTNGKLWGANSKNLIVSAVDFQNTGWRKHFDPDKYLFSGYFFGFEKMKEPSDDGF